MDLLLMNDIEEYNNIQNKIKELTTRKNELNESIKKQLIEDNTDNVETTNGVKAILTKKVSLKYDEVAVMKYLKDNNLTDYIIEKIDNKKLDKDLKTSKSLNESIQPTQDVSYSLTVK